MTEQDWLASDDPAAMLKHLTESLSPNMRRLGAVPESRVSDRKLRLFACACCRIADEVRHPIGKDAVFAAEKLADRLIDSKARGVAYNTTDNLPNPVQRLWAQACLRASASGGAFDVATHLKRPGQAVLLREIVGNPFRPVTLPQVVVGMRKTTRRIPRLVHPMVPVTDVPVYECPWITPTVLSLAQVAYARDECEHCIGPGGERLHYTGKMQHQPCPECGRGAFWTADGTLDAGTLAVLSDALEEAGCSDDAILSHLRSPGPHVRGCWALDLILGKE